MTGSSFKKSGSFLHILVYAFVACQVIVIAVYLLPTALRLDSNINCYNKNYNSNYKHLTLYSVFPDIIFSGSLKQLTLYYNDCLCDISKYRNEMLRDIRRTKNTNDFLVYLFSKAFQLFLYFFREILVLAITIHFQFLIKTVLYNMIPTHLEEYLFKGRGGKSKSGRRKSRSKSSGSNDTTKRNTLKDGKYSDDDNDSDSDENAAKFSLTKGQKSDNSNSSSNSNLFGLRGAIMNTLTCSLDPHSSPPELERDPAFSASFDEQESGSSSSPKERSMLQSYQKDKDEEVIRSDYEDYHVFDPVFGVIPATILQLWQQQEAQMRVKIEDAKKYPRILPPVRNSQL